MPGEERTGSGPPNVVARNVVIAILVGCVIAAYLGQTLVGNLVVRHPLLLIALNARASILILASPHLSAPSFYAVGMARVTLSFPLFFVLGRWYGDGAIRWVERRSSSYGRMARTAERWFSKAAYPMVFAIPNDYFCLFAGASGMSSIGFLVCLEVGNVVRLYLIRSLGQRLTHPLDTVTHWMSQHWPIVMVAMIVLIGLSLWSERRQDGGGGELSGLVHLADEVEHDAARPAPEPAEPSESTPDP